MKILALYLPQYHRIPENDKWWGEGYTEWTAVRNAAPLYKGHKEPRIPLNNNYYDLSDETGSVWKWQAALAKKYGVYGFCIYHYWFEGRQLLEKPMEILRDHPEIDINYCICWANETWSRNWYAQERTTLMEQTYGERESWEQHYKYLNTFFKDERYIKINNKPVINIYHSQEIEELPEMIDTWNILAKEEGFEGVFVVSGITGKGWDDRENCIDARYIFEPGYTLKNRMKGIDRYKYLLSVFTRRFLNRCFSAGVVEHKIDTRKIYNYIEKNNLPKNIFPGTFPQWDNTPRTGTMGLSYINSSPELFKEHLKKLATKYKDAEYIYINAWNEWGEGAYLEPDEEYGYGYLEAIQKVIAGN